MADTISGVVHQLMAENLEPDEERYAVTVRVYETTVRALDWLASELHTSRSSLAADLLHAACEQAAGDYLSHFKGTDREALQASLRAAVLGDE